MKRAKRYAVLLAGRERLSDDTVEMALSKPSGYVFEAGQYLTVTLDAIERDYTIVSAPDDPLLRFCYRQVEGGEMSSRLGKTEIGAQLTISGPAGYFRFHRSVAAPVFIATGTGIAPFVAMARAGSRDFILLHGARDRAGCHYAAELAAAAAQYVQCLSGGAPDDDGGAGETLFSGRVTDYLADRVAAGAYDFYLCGRSEMIRDVTLLVDERFPGSRLFFELFY